MWSDDPKFDTLFANVTRSAEGIENLCDVFFGFLRRNTDFFVAHGDPTIPQNVILGACKKHQNLALEAKEKEKASRRSQKHDPPQKVVPRIEEIDESEAPPVAKHSKVSSPTGAAHVPPSAEDPKNFEPAAESDDDAGNLDDDPSKHGNGGKTDNYVWTQTLGTVDVSVPVPPGTRSAQCSVHLTPSKVTVGIKGQPPMIEGEFCGKIKCDDSYWTLVENRVIQLTIEKHDNMRWWECVVKGDPTIDTKKIVPENSKLSDLDGETRATVEKMMFDQQAKELGKPTSDQRKQAEVLERFKQQHPEMDFSQANVNWGGSSSVFG